MSTFKTPLKQIKRQRERRVRRIQKRIRGTSERPRLSVFRSNKQIYAQIINDEAGSTLAAASSLKLEKIGGNIKGAQSIGEEIAKKAIEKGIKKVVFDRRDYRYHGRVKALAEAARKAGLIF